MEAMAQARRGGRRAAIFPYVMAGLETLTFSSSAVSLFNYFHGYMNFNLARSANALTNFMGTAFLLSLFGGFISDTYISRFKTCLVFGSIEATGYALLAVQAHTKHLRPFPCKDVPPSQADQCEPASTHQQAMLFTSLYLVALGNGGVKAALPSLGADQFDPRNPKEAPRLSSYFNWYFFFVNMGAILGLTFVVWINTNTGWDWAFGVCSMCIVTGVLVLSSGRSWYRHNVPKGSPITRILQVFVLAFKNRNLPLPANDEELHEDRDKEDEQTEFLQRTHQFRFLDHAAIITHEHGTRAWNTCTVTQVEETKILVRMVPLIVTTFVFNICLSQLQTFTVQQSTISDRRIGAFEIPPSSIGVIPLLFVFLLIPLYDRTFVPLARKLTGNPTGITPLQRIGTGLALSAASMAAAGFVEVRRKGVAGRRGGHRPMSVFWLMIQDAVFGVAEVFTQIGLLDFFYAESSSGMKSLGLAVSWCSYAFGYFGSSVVVTVVNKASGGWLAGNDLDEDRLEYFYWLLAGLSMANLGVFLVCAWWYRYKKVEVVRRRVGHTGGSRVET